MTGEGRKNSTVMQKVIQKRTEKGFCRPWVTGRVHTLNSTEYCPKNVGFPFCVHTERALWNVCELKEKNKKQCVLVLLLIASYERSNAHTRHIVLFVAIILPMNWRYALFCKSCVKLKKRTFTSRQGFLGKKRENNNLVHCLPMVFKY